MRLNAGRMFLVSEHLSNGGEIIWKGKRFVWLEHHKIRETDTHEWFIDGLAYVGHSYSGDPNDPDTEVEETFISAKDLSFNNFVQMVNELSLDEYTRIIQEVQRVRRG
jgi:hypothetical protein